MLLAQSHGHIPRLASADCGDRTSITLTRLQLAMASSSRRVFIAFVFSPPTAIMFIGVPEAGNDGCR